MKKIKIFLPLLVVFVALLLTMSCERDESFLVEELVSLQRSKIAVNRISFEELSTKRQLSKTIQKIAKRFDFNKTINNQRDIVSVDGSFTILTNEILETINDSITTYTFRIETPIDSTATFENFIIKQEGDTYKYWIYRYKQEANLPPIFPYTISSLEVNEDQINASDFDTYLNSRFTIIGGNIYQVVWVPVDYAGMGGGGYWSEVLVWSGGTWYGPYEGYNSDISGQGDTTGGYQNDSGSNNYGNDSYNHGGNILISDGNLDPNGGGGGAILSSSAVVSPLPAMTMEQYIEILKSSIRDCLGAYILDNGDTTVNAWLDNTDFGDSNNFINLKRLNSFLNTPIDNGLNAPTGETNCSSPQAQAFAIDAIQNNTVNQYLSENFEYSQNSPFTVDMSDVLNTIDSIALPTDSTSIAAKKFKCIYDKLTHSPKFKQLFVDTFGGSDSLHVKFEILSLPDSIGGQTLLNGTPITKQVIQMNKNKILNQHPLVTARTIMHESIHAYLNVKLYNCGLGTTLDFLNNQDLEYLLNTYYNTCVVGQSQHEFMFDKMIPTMTQILTDVQPFLVDPNDIGNSYIYYYTPISGAIVSDIFTWEKLYYYTILNGLQNTEAYQFEFDGNDLHNFLIREYSGEINNPVRFVQDTCNQ